MTWKTSSTPSDVLGMTLNCILFWHYIAFTVYSADVPLRNHIQLGYTHIGVDRGGSPGPDPPNHATRGVRLWTDPPNFWTKKMTFVSSDTDSSEVFFSVRQAEKNSVFSSHHQLPSLCLTIHRLLSQPTQSLRGVHEEAKYPLHGI
jgi:hypothetical protein